MKRFNPEDPSSLEERSRRPKHLRQPETDWQTVAAVGWYRQREPFISKETIAEKLLLERGVHVSPATVGRIIHRNTFFFATTPAHRRKREEAMRRASKDQQGPAWESTFPFDPTIHPLSA
jgi:transposase